MPENKLENEDITSVIRTIYNIFDARGLSKDEQMCSLAITGMAYKQFRKPELIYVDENGSPN